MTVCAPIFRRAASRRSYDGDIRTVEPLNRLRDRADVSGTMDMCDVHALNAPCTAVPLILFRAVARASGSRVSRTAAASAMYLRLRQLRASSGPSSIVLIMPPKKPLMTRGPTSGIHAHVRQGILFDVLPERSLPLLSVSSKGFAI